MGAIDDDARTADRDRIECDIGTGVGRAGVRGNERNSKGQCRSVHCGIS
jgi:hypothetical protein